MNQLALDAAAAADIGDYISRLTAAPYHEAAHAVIARMLGWSAAPRPSHAMANISASQNAAMHSDIGTA
jgi:hypothetical protein